MCLKGISEKIAILEKNMLILLFKHGLDFEPRVVFRARRSGREKAREVILDPKAKHISGLQVPAGKLAVPHLERLCCSRELTPWESYSSSAWKSERATVFALKLTCCPGSWAEIPGDSG